MKERIGTYTLGIALAIVFIFTTIVIFEVPAIPAWAKLAALFGGAVLLTLIEERVLSS